MRVATWNVNSVTVRLPKMLDWLAEAEPDVVCLQELKNPPEAFPHDELAALGYHAAINADGRWNGVAILSRVGADDVVDRADRAAGVRGHRRAAGDRGHLRRRTPLVGLRPQRARAVAPALRLQAGLARGAAHDDRRRGAAATPLRRARGLQRRAHRRRRVGHGRLRRPDPRHGAGAGGAGRRCATSACATSSRGP